MGMQHTLEGHKPSRTLRKGKPLMMERLNLPWALVSLSRACVSRPPIPVYLSLRVTCKPLGTESTMLSTWPPTWPPDGARDRRTVAAVWHHQEDTRSASRRSERSRAHKTLSDGGEVTNGDGQGWTTKRRLICRTCPASRPLTPA